MSRRQVTMDGNEAVASVAHRTNEVIAIYPITPSSNMGEWADEWSAKGQTEHLGDGPQRLRDAVRGRRGRRGARRAAGRRADDDLHGVAGPAAHDPQHVQDRRRADLVRHARVGPHARHPRPLDLRRPLRRDGGPADRLRAALPRPRSRRRTTSRSSRSAPPSRPASPSSTSSTASAPRTRWPRSRSSTTTTCAQMIPEDLVAAAPRPGPLARPPRAPRHRPEPGRLLPGARGLQPLLRRRRRPRAGRRWTSSPSSPAAQYKLFDYCGHPEAERVRRAHGLRRRDRPGDGRLPERHGREGRRAQGPALPALRARARSWPRCPRTVKTIAVLDRTKEPGSLGEPLYHGRGHRAARGGAGPHRPLPPPARRSSAAATASPPRSSRRPWSRRSSTSWQGPAPSATSRSASTTTSPTSRLDVRPDLRHRAGRRGPGRLLRPGRRRHGRRQQELDQDHRRGHAQLRPGLLRLRLEEVRRHHHLAPALRPAAHPLGLPGHPGQLRGLPPVRLPGEVRHAGAAPCRARPSCSTRPTARTRSGTSSRARCRQQIIEKKLKFYVIDAYKVARDTGMGVRINTIMQTCFFAISGVLPRDEAIDAHQEGHREDLRAQGRGGGEEELRRRRPHPRAPPRGEASRASRPAARRGRRWWPRSPPTS